MTPRIFVTTLCRGRLLRVFDAGSPPPPYPTDTLYIGRPQPDQLGSPLANPYHLHNEEDRARVLDAYRWWLQGHFWGPQDSPVFLELLKVLKLSLRPQGVALACWCAPLPCHGQVIREFVHALYNAGWRA